MAKKICILTGIYPPEVGGPATFAEHFSEFAIESGVRVKILSYCDGKSRKIKRNNLVIFQLSRDFPLPIRYLLICLKILWAYLRGYRVIANGCFLEIALLRMFFPIKFITKIPGDIVWERARNMELTSSDIDSFQDEHLKFSLRVMRFLFHYSISHSSQVIVPSRHLSKLAIMWGAKSQKVRIIYNSISLEDFPFLRNNDYDFDLLCVARLVKWKGLREVIEVAAKMGLSLGLVGTGPEEKELKELSARLKARVTFLGNKSQRELSSIYARSKYFILNSNFEATSYALLEARATGLVSIGRLNTGSEEVISDRNDGLLCGPEFSLFQAVELLVKNNVNVEKFEKEARRDIENRFNQKRNFRAILDLLTNV